MTLHGDFVHLDGVELDYVYQERRPKDVPIYIGATGMQMMELAGEIADGVVLNYLVSPAYNERGPRAIWPRARPRRAGRSTTSTGRSWWCARSTLTGGPPSTRLACSSPSTSGQQPHIMKASGVPDEHRWTTSDEVLTWPATHDQVSAAAALVPDEVVAA